MKYSSIAFKKWLANIYLIFFNKSINFSLLFLLLKSKSWIGHVLDLLLLLRGVVLSLILPEFLEVLKIIFEFISWFYSFLIKDLE